MTEPDRRPQDARPCQMCGHNGYSHAADGCKRLDEPNLNNRRTLCGCTHYEPPQTTKHD